MGADGKRDFTRGVAFSEIPDGIPVTGSVGEEEAYWSARRQSLRVEAHCTHYHGALVDVLLLGIPFAARCTMHVSTFVAGACARPHSTYYVLAGRAGGEMAFVREKLTPPRCLGSTLGTPRSVVIVAEGLLGCLRRILWRRRGMRPGNPGQCGRFAAGRSA